MTFLADSNSFHNGDDRVEVVCDLAELQEQAMKLVANAVTAALNAEHADGPDHVTVLITGDEHIRELNKKFKRTNEITDVLSFNEALVSRCSKDGATNDDPDVNRPSSVTAENIEFRTLGEIAISLPQVNRQAAQNGKSADRELAMLTIHGVLHLLGYHHAEPDEERIMFGKTDAVLATVLWK